MAASRRQRRLGKQPKLGESNGVVRPELRPPGRKSAPKPLDDPRSRFKLHRMPLPIVEAHGLDLPEARERPGETDGTVLPAGKHNQRPLMRPGGCGRHLVLGLRRHRPTASRRICLKA